MSHLAGVQMQQRMNSDEISSPDSQYKGAKKSVMLAAARYERRRHAHRRPQLSGRRGFFAKSLSVAAATELSGWRYEGYGTYS